MLVSGGLFLVVLVCTAVSTDAVRQLPDADVADAVLGKQPSHVRFHTSWTHYE